MNKSTFSRKLDIHCSASKKWLKLKFENKKEIVQYNNNVLPKQR
jgi:hypothetical protein